MKETTEFTEKREVVNREQIKKQKIIYPQMDTNSTKNGKQNTKNIYP